MQWEDALYVHVGYAFCSDCGIAQKEVGLLCQEVNICNNHVESIREQ
jgi:hypothetical protein